MKRVGEFTYNDGSVSGPAQYMREKGNAKLDEIMSGRSHVFNMGCTLSPDVETAVLVALQTDYAGWKGMQSFRLTSRQNAGTI